MASISTDSSGNRRILFTNRDGIRKTVYVGPIPKKQTDAICVKVEALNAALISGVAPADEVTRWATGIGDELQRKLANAGLLGLRVQPAAPAVTTLDGFLVQFIADNPDKSPRTVIHYRQCRSILGEFFGTDCLLAELTKGDAKRFVSWLRGTKQKKSGELLGENTVRGHIKTAKTFFNAMVYSELRTDNPFRGISHDQVKRMDRMTFLDRDTIDRVLKACPDARWRAIVSLCRFGGLRCPSEVLALKWADVDFERARLRVRSPKGENFGKGLRELPLFPELRTALEELFCEPDGGEFVIASNDRTGDKNLRTTFQKIVKRAGLEPWERLFSSRAEELTRDWPIHVATEWLGHTPDVARDNYLKSRDTDFETATKTTRIPTQQASATDSIASFGASVGNKKPLVPQGYPTKQGVSELQIVHPAGLEPATFGSVV